MNIRKIAVFVLFLSLFLFANPASASAESNRYLVRSSSSLLRKSVGVRHDFASRGAFSADLTNFQVRFAKMLGAEVEPVRIFQILPAEKTIQVARAMKDKTIQTTPLEQISWGIKALYGDVNLSKTNGGKDVNVAVLDTGVLANHQDLADRITQCKTFTNPKTPILDGKCEDKNGHGTHIAGIIAADGGPITGNGIYGVAPEANILA